MKNRQHPEVATVTLNAAIDQTISISNFTVGQVNRVEAERSNPGGKGVNVAAALADYGHSVAVTGFLGRENAGEFEAMFARKQIADHFVRTAGRARTGIKITDPARQITTDINFSGMSPTAADIEALWETLAKLGAGQKWFILSGSLPPGVPVTIYRDMVVWLKARGHKVLVDTSGEALAHAVKAAPHSLKPNIHELEVLLGRKCSCEADVCDGARELLTGGVELVAVSLGENGALFVTAESVVAARPPRIAVKSTVGAGDAMVAGIVAAQVQGQPLDVCACLATAFALEVLTRGTSGLSSAAAVAEWSKQVSVAKVERLHG